MLFRHQDLSLIKEFCRQEWTKILQGRVSIQDFIVAKEVRLGSYSYVFLSFVWYYSAVS
jgi:DNA polymerase zeta